MQRRHGRSDGVLFVFCCECETVGNFRRCPAIIQNEVFSGEQVGVEVVSAEEIAFGIGGTSCEAGCDDVMLNE
jgi:hypothetical protein